MFDVAVYTETYKIFVIYYSVDEPGKVYARPVSMFLSEVDRVKYPNVT